MSSEHTPGPWLAGKPSSVVGWPIVAPAALGRLIANVSYAAHSPTDPKVPGDDAFNRESAANARLIASATELLAVAYIGLEAVERELQGIVESHSLLDPETLIPRPDTLDEDVKAEVAELSHRRDLIRAAIAKATGA